MNRWRKYIIGTTVALSVAAPGVADETLTYGIYGTPGLIAMPTAQSAPDGELAFTFSQSADSLRGSMTFQVLPRLSGTFRYTQIKNWTNDPSSPYLEGGYYDRSFDLRYRFVDEGTYRPAIAVGLQDFIGTGLYSGEYVVATKSFANGKVKATGGIGWGRLGTQNSFSNPLSSVFGSGFDTRNTGFTGTGGQIESAKWFRGPAAMFGGVSWAVTDRLTAKVEYSSDNVRFDRQNNTTFGTSSITHTSPLNYGIDYRLGKRTHLAAYYMHGSDIGVQLTFGSNPKTNRQTREGAPIPVLTRAPGSAADLGWAAAAEPTRDALVKGLAPLMAADGIILEGMELSGRTVTVRIRNTKYRSNAQAVGRTARILSNALPASVEEFKIVPIEKGMATSQVVISRSALERYENDFDGTENIFAATRFEDASDVDRRAGLNSDLYPKLTWNLAPYAQASIFDPSNPIRIDAGLQLSGEWNPTPGLYFSGSMRKRLVGNLADSTRASDSKIPHVRSDANVYDKYDDPTLSRLTAAYFFRPGDNLYGRVTAGYLERMYGGVSAELLWKPVGSRLALGVEVNAVKQRSFDDMFGFTIRDTNPLGTNTRTTQLADLDTYPETTYSTVTGHASAYYQLNNGFHAQLDVGRYLAGDWGATLTLDREFKNGWVVGAYATVTDLSAEEFGEGSFDKGIRVIIPTDWQLGTPSRKKRATVIQPLLRDGGARLDVEDRLYGLVRDTHKPQLETSWGRFWR